MGTIRRAQVPGEQFWEVSKRVQHLVNFERFFPVFAYPCYFNRDFEGQDDLGSNFWQHTAERAARDLDIIGLQILKSAFEEAPVS